MLSFLKTTILILALALGAHGTDTVSRCRNWTNVNTEIYAEVYAYIDRMIDVDAMCGTPRICKGYADAAQAYRNASYIAPFPFYNAAFPDVCNMHLTSDICQKILP